MCPRTPQAQPRFWNSYVPVRSFLDCTPYAFPMYNETQFSTAVRSYAFRATLSQFLQIVIRSYMFLLHSVDAPHTPQITSIQILIHSYAFLLRSVYVLHTKQKHRTNSYTFLYVLCNHPAIRANSYKFLKVYAPSTFRIRSPYKTKETCQKVYVFLYVPCNPYTTYVNWSTCPYLLKG